MHFQRRFTARNQTLRHKTARKAPRKCFDKNRSFLRQTTGFYGEKYAVRFYRKQDIQQKQFTVKDRFLRQKSVRKECRKNVSSPEEIYGKKKAI